MKKETKKGIYHILRITIIITLACIFLIWFYTFMCGLNYKY